VKFIRPSFLAIALDSLFTISMMMNTGINFFRLSFSFAGLFFSANVFSCTEEFKPVCGYWMHSPKTQTFVNECKMREAGAKIRHTGSCSDKNPPASNSKPTTK